MMERPQLTQLQQAALDLISQHIAAGGRLILASRCSYDAGELLTGFYVDCKPDEASTVLVPQPCRVVRMATFEEFLAEARPDVRRAWSAGPEDYTFVLLEAD
jgi:hypothetical protein